MENSTRVQEGISLLELLKVMFGYNKKGRIRFLCVALGVALVTLLAVLFGYNNKKENYESKFNYLVESFDGNTYLDGTKFIQLDLISEENLTKIKESDSSFSNIDVDGMLDSDSISIVRNTGDEEIYAFTLVVKKSFFNSSTQAEKFVRAIADTPKNITNEMIDKLNYGSALDSYTNYDESYETKINDLITQRELITATYLTLIEKYGERYLDSSFGDNQTLMTIQNKALKLMANLELENLSKEVNTKGYVLNYDKALPELTIKLDDCNARLAVVNTKIESIKSEIGSSGASTTADGLNQILANLIVEREDLNTEIEKLNTKISNGKTADTKSFDEKLANAYDTLEELTDELTNAHKFVLKQNQKVYFASKNVVTKTGGLSLLFTIAITVVAGLGVAVLVNLIMDLYNYKEAVLKGILEVSKKEETKED